VLICGHLHTARMDSIGGGNFLFVVPAWTEQAGGVLDDGRGVKPFEL
jgi:UDP-2,3-diacylglucosamine pyrophosphatase LpxH